MNQLFGLPVWSLLLIVLGIACLAAIYLLFKKLQGMSEEQTRSASTERAALVEVLSKLSTHMERIAQLQEETLAVMRGGYFDRDAAKHGEFHCVEEPIEVGDDLALDDRAAEALRRRQQAEAASSQASLSDTATSSVVTAAAGLAAATGLAVAAETYDAADDEMVEPAAPAPVPPGAEPASDFLMDDSAPQLALTDTVVPHGNLPPPFPADEHAEQPFVQEVPRQRPPWFSDGEDADEGFSDSPNAVAEQATPASHALPDAVAEAPELESAPESQVSEEPGIVWEDAEDAFGSQETGVLAEEEDALWADAPASLGGPAGVEFQAPLDFAADTQTQDVPFQDASSAGLHEDLMDEESLEDSNIFDDTSVFGESFAASVAGINDVAIGEGSIAAAADDGEPVFVEEEEPASEESIADAAAFEDDDSIAFFEESSDTATITAEADSEEPGVFFVDPEEIDEPALAQDPYVMEAPDFESAASQLGGLTGTEDTPLFEEDSQKEAAAQPSLVEEAAAPAQSSEDLVLDGHTDIDVDDIFQHIETEDDASLWEDDGAAMPAPESFLEDEGEKPSSFFSSDAFDTSEEDDTAAPAHPESAALQAPTASDLRFEKAAAPADQATLGALPDDEDMDFDIDLPENPDFTGAIEEESAMAFQEALAPAGDASALVFDAAVAGDEEAAHGMTPKEAEDDDLFLDFEGESEPQMIVSGDEDLTSALDEEDLTFDIPPSSPEASLAQAPAGESGDGSESDTFLLEDEPVASFADDDTFALADDLANEVEDAEMFGLHSDDLGADTVPAGALDQETEYIMGSGVIMDSTDNGDQGESLSQAVLEDDETLFFETPTETMARAARSASFERDAPLPDNGAHDHAAFELQGEDDAIIEFDAPEQEQSSTWQETPAEQPAETDAPGGATLSMADEDDELIFMEDEPPAGNSQDTYTWESPAQSDAPMKQTPLIEDDDDDIGISFVDADDEASISFVEPSPSAGGNAAGFERDAEESSILFDEEADDLISFEPTIMRDTERDSEGSFDDQLERDIAALEDIISFDDDGVGGGTSSGRV